MTRLLFGLLLVLLATPPAAADAPTDDQAVRAIARLLPRAPARIVLLDPERDVEAGAARAKVAGLDAFAANDGRVFVNVRSALFQAAKTSDFYRHAFAAVLWHEVAHLDGADEREAQRREADLWTAFIRDGKVDQANGLRYARELARRRH